MTVVSVTERFQEREGRAVEEGHNEYVRSFMVQTDNANDGPVTVLQAPGIPRKHQVYISGNDSSPYATCRSVEATPVDGTRILWIVRAEYSNKFGLTGTQADKIENPLERPPSIRWGHTFLTKLATKGRLKLLNGTVEAEKTGIVNSAQDPFDPPAEMDDARPTLNITKNFATFEPSVATEYTNAVNSDPWMGGQPRQWKCMGITGTSQVEQINELPFLYWVREYEFHFDKDTFDKQITDQGFTAINGLNRIPIAGVGDQPKAEPTNLDGAGAVLPVGDPVVFRVYRVYEEKSFLQLGLT